MKRKLVIISNTRMNYSRLLLRDNIFYIIPETWWRYCEILWAFSEIRDLDR